MSSVSGAPWIDVVLVRVSRVFFGAVCAISGAALAGWCVDNIFLKSFFPGLMAMNPVTAILFICSGLAGLLAGRPGRIRRRSALGLSVLVIVVSADRLAGYAAPSLNLGLDQILFSDKLAGNAMAPNTAALFLLSGLALAFSESQRRLLAWVRAAVEAAALPLSGVALLGYLYNIKGLYHVQAHIPMALNTAVSFLLLTFAILARRPDRGLFFPLLSSHKPGGVVARRLLPAVVIVPVFLGMLHLQFRKWDFLDVQTDAALFVVAAIVIFLWLIAVTARVIDQADAGRQRAEEELMKVNQNLEVMVQERTKKLEEAQNRLIEQERLRTLGEMSSGIAHDFNNALSPILGYTELIKEDPTILQDRDTAMSFIAGIHTSAQDAAQIVARMREFSRRTQAGDAYGPVDMRKVAQSAIQLTRHKWKTQALARGVRIDLRSELEDAWVDGSEAEFREVLTNLIFNAADAMERDGSITVRLLKQEGAVLLEVKDTGLGMTEEVRRKCLEPFFSTKGERGSGLGLSMVHNIVVRSGGSLEIESSPGQGTAIRLKFPQGRLTPGVPAVAAAPKARPLRILFADDDDSVRAVITRYLAQDGHQVDVAADGRMALARAASKQQFDLVISDYAMPHMGGVELAQKLRERSPKIPIILLTGSDSVEPVPGVAEVVLKKPVTLQDLRAAILRIFPR